MTNGRSWFEPSELDAVEDYWRVYDANYADVFARMVSRAQSSPELSKVIDSLSMVDLDELREGSRKRIYRALHGDTSEYEAALRAEATAWARHGVRFAHWYIIRRALSEALSPLLIAAYESEPSRLHEALRMMSKHLDCMMTVLGTAYIDEKEGALRAKEHDLATTFESIGDGVIATDLDGCVVRMNSAAQRLTGFTFHEARERRAADVFVIVYEDGDAGEAVRESAIDRVLRGAVTTRDENAWLIKKDGKRCPIADSGAPIRDDDGTVRGAVLVFRDQTEEHRTQRALHESRARKAAILEASIDAIITMTHDGTIIEFNSAATRMFGFSHDEILGKSFETLVPRRHREAPRSALAEFATGESAELGRRVEHTALRSDGTELPVESVVVRIAGDGPPVFTAFIRDITDVKRAREEAIANQNQLRLLAARLRDAREDEARRIAREVHDVLGQSLTAIKLDIGFVESRLGKAVDESASAVLRERCAALLDVVDATMQSVRRIATELRPAALDDLGIEAALEWHAREFERRTGVGVAVDVPQTELPLDREQSTALFRIVQEALTNVARHASAKKVELVLTTEHERVVLVVKDDGKGIAPQEPAHHGGGGATSPTGGLGILGMRERVSLLGGTLDVESAPRKGTAVIATLPLRHEEGAR